MKYWNEYKGHKSEILGKRKKFDNTIYSFDIETSSYLIVDGEVIPAIKYETLTEEQRNKSIKCSCMYIWQFSINDQVYYGRTWDELHSFLNKLYENTPERKFVFVHNLAFEFQYLKSYFEFEDVVARKSRKVMTAYNPTYNILFKCSYIMSNCALKYLPDLFNLPIQKDVGDLDYSLIRTSITPLSEQELKYCEDDCLVVYHYILNELQTYEDVSNIPTTSTGKVRRELKQLVLKDWKYKRLVNKAINTDPHVYNLLQQAFMGGYTHASYVYADTIIEDVDSWDFTSSYPYILVTHKFPSSEFKRCNIKRVEQMSKRLCYLLVVKFKNVDCKYFNTFISASKCRNIRGANYDNGRIISADEFEMTLTDIDFYFFLESYKFEYEIIESYYCNYNYLPKQFIEFVLEKYVNKTQFKDVEGKEIDYQKEKNKFNSLYGMAVTNTIRSNVIFDDTIKEWFEQPLTNEEIVKKLNDEKKTSFLSFAYGVWCTAYARNNLLKNVIKLDEYAIYMDTDSIKVKHGYDKKVIEDYNNFVKHKIEFVSNLLDIDINKYSPCDVHGVPHMLGLFDDDGHYKKFVTQGAKKYAFIKEMDLKKAIKKEKNIISTFDDKADVLEITVAGVPKGGAKALKCLEDFKDDFVFKYEDTNKNTVMYCEHQEPCLLTDYLGNKYEVKDVSGCCLLPTTYILGKSLEYANLLTDNSSARAIYKED